MISMILMINVFTQPRALQCSASECNKATEENLVIIHQNDSGSPFHHVSPILALPPGRSEYACLDGVGVERSCV